MTKHPENRPKLTLIQSSYHFPMPIHWLSSLIHGAGYWCLPQCYMFFQRTATKCRTVMEPYTGMQSSTFMSAVSDPLMSCHIPLQWCQHRPKQDTNGLLLLLCHPLLPHHLCNLCMLLQVTLTTSIPRTTVWTCFHVCCCFSWSHPCAQTKTLDPAWSLYTHIYQTVPVQHQNAWSKKCKWMLLCPTPMNGETNVGHPWNIVIFIIGNDL